MPLRLIQQPYLSEAIEDSCPPQEMIHANPRSTTLSDLGHVLAWNPAEKGTLKNTHSHTHTNTNTNTNANTNTNTPIRPLKYLRNLSARPSPSDWMAALYLTDQIVSNKNGGLFLDGCKKYQKQKVKGFQGYTVAKQQLTSVD